MQFFPVTEAETLALKADEQQKLTKTTNSSIAAKVQIQVSESNFQGK